MARKRPRRAVMRSLPRQPEGNILGRARAWCTPRREGDRTQQPRQNRRAADSQDSQRRYGLPAFHGRSGGTGSVNPDDQDNDGIHLRLGRFLEFRSSRGHVPLPVTILLMEALVVRAIP